jgi:ribosomal-protein-alanine N-acetyltransferase
MPTPIVFGDLKLNRLEAAINLDNLRSVGLAQSLRMRREGIKRRYLYENEKWTDQIIFAANPE